MKKLLLSATFILSATVFFPASAQVRLNVNVNIGVQPQWGPAGYDYVDYYYLPDIEAYYYVPSRQFIYLSGNNWVFSYGLPPAYRNYDLYHGYKVVINQPRAYLYFPNHKVKYSRYKGNHSQVIIMKSKSPKYKSYSKGNDKHSGKQKGRH